MREELTLLAVFAHPDDEAFGCGGTLSKYAAEGVTVHLVTATRGEAGGIAVPGLASLANLPDVRERELRCACQAYGIEPPHLLDYVDGHLTVMHQGQAVGKLVRLIRDIRPQVMITFGPDGIYGHYDHIAVHRWATIAYDLAADPDCFPDVSPDGELVCAPHQVAKLYYRAITQQQIDEWVDYGMSSAVMMDGVPFPFVGHPDDAITTVIDVHTMVENKIEGIRCHRSQIGDENPYVEAPEAVTSRPSFRQETYILARSTVEIPKGVETDLFTGLRAPTSHGSRAETG
jgi:LmbE family N-acetylglucosaminyl deacetylase